MALPSIPKHYEHDSTDYWVQFLTSQRGGSGLERFYISDIHQRGSGIGSLLRTWGAALAPLVKTVALPALLKGVGHISSDLLKGKPAKPTLETHGKSAAADLLERAAKEIKKRNNIRKPKRLKKDIFSQRKK